MYKKKHIRRQIGICLMVLTCPHWEAQAQIPGGALDYLLQRPAVSKRFEHKKFGDHLFMDAGMGTNMMGHASKEFGALGKLQVGDWITPEHGARVGVQGGMWNLGYDKVKFGGISLDYLMNINAIAHRSYKRPQPWEFYAIAGLDVMASKKDENKEIGLGAHVALRGQYAITPLTYLYIEPTLGFVSTKLAQTDNWRKMQSYAGISAGLGYRLQTGANRAHTVYREKGALENMFFSVATGPSLLLSNSTWPDRERLGGKVALGLGKWFNPHHALRLSASYASQRMPYELLNTRVYGVQLDYMLNLHNLFAGPDVTRPWNLNAVVGGSVSASINEADFCQKALGLGVGLQGNIRLNEHLDAYVEPRVDVYKSTYMPLYPSDPNLVASLMAGITYNYHSSTLRQADPDEQFEHNYWHDHLFFEAGAGFNLPVRHYPVSMPARHFQPLGALAIGKFFTPLHGARIRVQGGRIESVMNASKAYGDIGLDYLLDLTNLCRGYIPQRHFGVIASVGGDIGFRRNQHQAYWGLSASAKAIWNVTPSLGIFVEPRLQAYKSGFLDANDEVGGRPDLLASAVAGLQVNLGAYHKSATWAEDEDNRKRPTLSFAGGGNVLLNDLGSKSAYGPAFRLSYQQWRGPLTSWRANLQFAKNKIGENNYGKASIGADYLIDLLAHLYGYDSQRVFTTNLVAGVNVGAEFLSTVGNGFVSDVHGGLQFSVRLADKWHLYAEPQVSYQLTDKLDLGRSNRLSGQFLLGVDYSFRKSREHKEASVVEHRDFASLALGTGMFSSTIHNPGSRKFTFNTDVAYGHWYNAHHGLQASLSQVSIPYEWDDKRHFSSLRLNYMMNVKSAILGESADETGFQLTGLAGVSVTLASGGGLSKKVVPGFQIALQPGYRFTPSLELFLQPEITAYSKKAELVRHSGHPLEGEVRLSLGTKYYF